MKNIMLMAAALSLFDNSTAPAQKSYQTYPIAQFPQSLDKNCLDGKAKLYDECGNQFDVLNPAIQAAKQSNKNVLIIYGGEWCIWCHVIDKYLHGYSRKFDYRWRYQNEMQHWTMYEKSNQKAEQEAAELNKYTADNFVIAHIENDASPNGKEVLKSIGFDTSQIGGIPVIIALNQHGKYAAHLPDIDLIKGLEIRYDSGQDYRGYNRKILLEQLKKLKVASMKP